jgi:serine/threonine protein kinase
MADFARQAASALEVVHRVGVLHRDVKPGNMLVDSSGHLWLTDFGLAHVAREGASLTRSGEFLGTLCYSSPEQVGGRAAVDARSDVYGLGASLYEMVTLRPPFAAAEHLGLVRRVATEDPVPPRAIDPGLPRDLETTVLQAMAKEPAQRYPSAAALADDLRAFLEGRPIVARPVTRLERGWR